MTEAIQNSIEAIRSLVAGKELTEDHFEHYLGKLESLLQGELNFSTGVKAGAILRGLSGARKSMAASQAKVEIREMLESIEDELMSL